MASLTYHHNKKTGTTYVYSVQSYWDKEKKSPRNKQKCLGKLNKETGEIIPSVKRSKIALRAASAPGVTATTLIAGPYLLLENLTKQMGLDILLKKCFPGASEMIMSLVYFLVQKGLPLAHCEPWSIAHEHPFGNILISQRISDLLSCISEDDRQKFLSLWLGKFIENDYLCYDITSVSSYAERNAYVKYGYNRDSEPLPQINLAMLFGQNSNLPAYYRRIPGNITDVATLKTTVQNLDFLGKRKINFVLDRGFYSQNNIDELFRRKHKFTIAIPAGRKWVEEIIDQYYDSIADPSNYLEVDDSEALYVVSRLYKWGTNKKRCYLHLYYNAQQAATEFDQFTKKLLRYKEELLSGKRLKEHEEYYRRYFLIKETPKRGTQISFNNEEIQKYRKRYAGFFCILSNSIKFPLEALNVYRTKDAVENSFDDLKNHLDMKRLRIHSAAAMDSRLFLQFLALIYTSQIRNTSMKDKVLKNLTVREIIENMETLVKIKYSQRYGQLYTETNPIQRKIMEVFGFSIPS